MAIKTYASIIYREDEDGEKVPFKVSAKTLVLYKEYTGNDLISDMTSIFNIKMQDIENMSEDDRKELANDIDKNKKQVDNSKVLNVVQNLILCARLAAYPTDAELQEAMLAGDDILPVNMLFDLDLGLDLVNLIVKETKKKIR